MSQLIMHALGQGDGRAEDVDGREPLVPALVGAEQLRKRLAEQGAAFDAADDWIEADLKLTRRAAVWREKCYGGKVFTPLVLRKLRSNKRVNAITHGLSQISMNTFQRSMRAPTREVEL